MELSFELVSEFMFLFEHHLTLRIGCRSRNGQRWNSCYISSYPVSSTIWCCETNCSRVPWSKHSRCARRRDGTAGKMKWSPTKTSNMSTCHNRHFNCRSKTKLIRLSEPLMGFNKGQKKASWRFHSSRRNQRNLLGFIKEEKWVLHLFTSYEGYSHTTWLL